MATGHPVLTIITYHYVRSAAHAPYPRLKALDTRDFEGQLDYIGRHYQVVALEDVAAAARGDRPLPPSGCLLTFDDGLLDHYVTVFPRLARRAWSGCFFPVPEATRGHRVLDVHKIQLILAVERDTQALVRRIMDAVSAARKDIELPSRETMLATLATPSRYDDAEVRFVKNALQDGLPQPLRSQVVHELFLDLVVQPEASLARELYMDVEQMQLMARAGMAFGGHGSHAWLGRSTREEQRDDFRQSGALVHQITGLPAEGWTMCYPHGSYNAETLETAREAGCALGLTTRAGVVHDFSRPFELPRMDATSLPFRRDGTALDVAVRFPAGPTVLSSEPEVVRPR